MPETTAIVRHKIILEDRKSLSITGVKKIRSFEPKEIVLDTVMGIINIKGHELCVNNLDIEQSEVQIEGRIDLLTYSSHKDGESGKGIWEKIFK